MLNASWESCAGMPTSETEENMPKQNLISPTGTMCGSTRKAGQPGRESPGSKEPESQKRVRFNPTSKVLNNSSTGGMQSESCRIDRNATPFTRSVKLEKVAISLFEGEDDEGNVGSKSFESLFPKRHSTPKPTIVEKSAPLVVQQRGPVKHYAGPLSPWKISKGNEQRKKEPVIKKRESLSMSLENGIQRIVKAEKRKIKQKNHKMKIFSREDMAELKQMMQATIREELRDVRISRRPTETKAVQVAIRTRHPTDEDRAVQTEEQQSCTVGVNTVPHVCEQHREEKAVEQMNLNRTAPVAAIKRRRASVPVNVTLPPEAEAIEQTGQTIRWLRSRRISVMLEEDEGEQQPHDHKSPASSAGDVPKDE